MKTHILKTTILLITASSIIGCSNAKKNVSMDALNSKIEEVENSIEDSDGIQWASENWEEVETSFLEAKNKVKKEKDELKEDWDESETNRRWEEVKRKVVEYNNSNEKKSTYVSNVCEAIGTDAPDEDLNYITSENIVDIYAKYVEVVKQDFSDYTFEEAKIISDVWDRLNERKEAVESIPVKDNLRIASIKADFAVVKTALKVKTSAEHVTKKVKEKYNEKVESK